MNKNTYDQIIAKLHGISTIEEKCKYLSSVIEKTDFDDESWNNELIELLKKYRNF